MSNNYTHTICESLMKIKTWFKTFNNTYIKISKKKHNFTRTPSVTCSYIWYSVILKLDTQSVKIW